MKKYYCYRHIRLDKNVPFYVGVGTIPKKSEFSTTDSCKYERAYNSTNRNSIWKRIVAKTDYKVEIIWETDDYNEVLEKEVEFITLYGRIDLKTGTLCNLTDGGEGCVNRILSEEEKIRISLRQKGVPKSKESIAKMVITKTGKKWSKKQIEAYTPRFLSYEDKIHLKTKMKGREIKWKDKIAQGNKGKAKSISHKNKSRNSRTYYYKLICKHSGRTWIGKGLKELSEVSNVSYKKLGHLWADGVGTIKSQYAIFKSIVVELPIF